MFVNELVLGRKDHQEVNKIALEALFETWPPILPHVAIPFTTILAPSPLNRQSFLHSFITLQTVVEYYVYT
jgi:hypothetical protein